MKERYAPQQLVPGLSMEASGRLEIVRVANATYDPYDRRCGRGIIANYKRVLKHSRLITGLKPHIPGFIPVLTI